jgi:HKD family nuclease
MKIEKQTLREQFQEMLDSSDDPVQRILVLTYEFDEQQLLNLLLQRQLAERLEPTPAHLANLADLSPVVIYDACKTKSSGLLPHFLELLPVKAKAWSCHHPKAYLVITQRRVHLLLGSMNLTASGIFTNREAYLAFRWSQDETEDLTLLADFARLLASEYTGSFDSPALRAILAILDDYIAAWMRPTKRGEVGPRLIASGFSERQPGLDQLLQIYIEKFSDRITPDALLVVAPFFDKSTDFEPLIDVIEQRLGQIGRKELVTAEDALETIAQRHLGSAGQRNVWSIPVEVVGDEKEQIRAANESAQVEHLKIDRALHAKLLILVADGRALIYLGSANFSRNAWLGRNHELGVAWWHDGDPDALWQALKKGLGCALGDRFAELPTQVAARSDTSDPEDIPPPDHYPDFVQRAELAPTDGGKLRFKLGFEAARAGALSDYRVEWGGLELTFDSGASQDISEDEARIRLFSGRNLLFIWRAAPTISYPLPFRHAAALFDARFEFVHPTPEDWMAHCLGRDRNGDGGPGGEEQLPGDDPPQPDRPDDGREDNPVVRMQRYLSDFALVEKTFESRAAQASTERWNDVVGKPLTTFARILERSAPGRTELSFQIGELLLLARRLKGPDAEIRMLIDALAKALPKVGAEEAGLASYQAYCHGAAA